MTTFKKGLASLIGAVLTYLANYFAIPVQSEYIEYLALGLAGVAAVLIAKAGLQKAAELLIGARFED